MLALHQSVFAGTPGVSVATFPFVPLSEKTQQRARFRPGGRWRWVQGFLVRRVSSSGRAKNTSKTFSNSGGSFFHPLFLQERFARRGHKFFFFYSLSLSQEESSLLPTCELRVIDLQLLQAVCDISLLSDYSGLVLKLSLIPGLLFYCRNAVFQGCDHCKS